MRMKLHVIDAFAVDTVCLLGVGRRRISSESIAVEICHESNAGYSRRTVVYRSSLHT